MRAPTAVGKVRGTMSDNTVTMEGALEEARNRC
jgi:hypothetical protein